MISNKEEIIMRNKTSFISIKTIIKIISLVAV